MRRRRLKMKQTEQYLPPEIQLHMLNERRRATRERVQRYRDRKSQNTTGKKYCKRTKRKLIAFSSSNHWPVQCFIFRNQKSKSKPRRKVPPKPEFVSEPPTSEPENLPDFSEPDTDDREFDFDLNPIVEIEEQIEILKQEPEHESEPASAVEPARTLRACRTVVKKEKLVVKSKSGYKRKRTFECYRCSLPCSKLYELRTHIQIFHPFTSEEPKKDVLNCPYCTKTTISREILSRHLRQVSIERLKWDDES